MLGAAESQRGRIVLGLGIASFSWLLSAQELQRVPPEAVAMRVGQIATVCGVVLDLGCSAPDPNAPFTFRTSAYAPFLSVAWPLEQGERFGPLAKGESLSPQSICVTGQIESAGQGYRIVVSRADQIEDDNASALMASRPAAGTYRDCDKGVAKPKLLRDVKPQYTADAMRAKIRGKVVLQGVVGTDGAVSDVHVIRSLDPQGLDVVTAKAFKQWLFEPGSYLGNVVPVVVVVEMTFTTK
jgi:TonB family protein